jgi:Cu-processing system ATP-binding protein
MNVQGVSKRFRTVQALDQVSFDLRPGRVLGLVGPNGCGKSTLIKSILGLVVPDQGTIRVGREVVGANSSYRQRLGYMPQNPDFPGNLTVRELLDMLEDVRGVPASKRQSLEVLFELESNRDRAFGVLSGGTKQKVAAVAAFMFDPDILVLDEPTVGLDPVSAAKFKKLVSETVAEGRSVVLVTHILSEIEAFVDDLVFILDGQVRYTGEMEDLLARTGCRTIEDAIIHLVQNGVSS